MRAQDSSERDTLCYYAALASETNLRKKIHFFSSFNSGSVATTVLRNNFSLTKKEAAQNLKKREKRNQK